MRSELTAGSLGQNNGKPLGPSRVAATGRRAVSDEAVLPLSLGERLVMSLGLLTACLIIQADQLIGRLRFAEIRRRPAQVVFGRRGTSA
jgi:hypothetical protein